MDKILIFTNAQKWRNISVEIRDRVKWDSFPNDNCPVMECAPGIYLVYDDIDDTRLRHLFENSSDDQYYVLIHTQGRQQEVFEPWKDRCLIERGRHENDPDELYLPVFDIITDDEGDQLQRIVKSIFMPIEEAVTELLHECHVPKRNLAESNSYRILYRKEEFRKDLDEFKKKYEVSESFDEYKEDLGKLRDLVFGHRQQST